MIPLTCMLLVKCRYGVANMDESFYLTIPYRLCQGDVLFLNEWHLSQLSGWILKLPLSVFLRLNGGTEGIYLAFRFLYTALHLCGSVVLFLLFRKRSGIGAVLASVFYYVYVPFGIMALSYNSMGLGFLSLSAAILVCTSKRWSDALSGFLFAMAVLCCPYLVILFVIYTAAVLLCRKRGTGLDFLSPKRFGFFFLGIAVPAFCMLLEVLPHIRPDQYSRIFAGIFSDPEHNTRLSFKLIHYFRILFDRNFLVIPGLIIVAGVLIKKPFVRNILNILILIFVAYRLVQSRESINFLIFPINTAGLYFYAVYRNRAVRDLFYGMWIPGMVYSLCIHLASNQVFYVISSASVVAMLASVIIIFVTLKDIWKDINPLIVKCALLCSLILVLVLQGALEVKLRWEQVFWEKGGIAAQTQLLQEGPHKGLLVSTEAEKKYLSAADAVSRLETQGSLLVVGNATYTYLFGSWTNSSYSAWIGTETEYVLDRLTMYYTLNPDKLPDQVIIQDTHAGCAPYFENDSRYERSCETDDGWQIFRRVQD